MQFSLPSLRRSCSPLRRTRSAFRACSGEKSPKCLAWTAKFHLADDGDTVKARILKGNKFGPRERVRLTGIQAPELFNYSRKTRRGACLGVEATETLEHLVHNSTGRLVAQKASSRSIGDTRVRLRRSIQIKRGGKWIDPAAELLKKGLALWFPNGQEWAWNGTYSRLAEEAAAQGPRHLEPGCVRQAGPVADEPAEHQAQVGRREQGPGERRVDPHHEPRPRQRGPAGRLGRA